MKNHLGSARLAAVLAVSVAACNFGSSTPGSQPDGGFEAGGTVGLAILSGSTVHQDFGSVAVGQTAKASVTITNTGRGQSATLVTSLTGAASFGVDSDGCAGKVLAAGETCTVGLHFAPTAAGAASGTLAVGDGGGVVAVALSGTGAGTATVSWSPSTQSFGPVGVGATTAPTTFTLANTGTAATAPVTVSLGGADSGQFATANDGCSGHPLAGGGQCSVDVSFAPTAAGTRSASLVAASGGTTLASAALSGTAATGAAFAVKPATYDFGSLPLAAPSGAQTFTVTNTGGTASGVPKIVASGANAADFAVAAGTCTGGLDAGAACSFSVTFTPSIAAAETATVTVSAGSATPATTSLTGTGLSAAALAVSPATQDFGVVATGASSTDFPFTVTNGGGVTSGPLSVSLSGSAAGSFQIGAQDCNGATLGAGGAGTCSVNVHFSPAAGVTGAVQATLLVAGSPGGTAAATLTGHATPPAALALTPSPFGFGAQAQGSATSPVTFTLTNSGGLDSSAVSVAVGGANAPDFALVADNCSGKTVAAGGGTCTMSVAFTPSTQAAESATLTASATQGGTATTTLSGTGEPPAALSIGPTPFDFGPVVQNTATPPTVTLTVTNTGGVSTSTPAVTVGGQNAADFQVQSNGCTAPVASGGTCSVVVSFKPSALGAESATVNVLASTGGSTTATLSGTGVTPAALSVSPSPGILGPVTIGQPATATFQVSNTGGSASGAPTVSITPSPGDFSATTTCSAAIPAKTNNACSIKVTFVPTSTSESATLKVAATPGGPVSVPLTGTGLTAAALSLSTTNPGGGNFGGVTVSTPSTIRFWLSNTGQSPSSAPSVSLTGNGDYSYTTSCPTSTGIAGSTNDACYVDVTFRPTSTGVTETAQLVVNATTGGPTPPVSLGGTGLTAAALSIAQVGSSGFGTVNDGSTSQVSFQVSNTGQSASGALSVGISGGTNPADFTVTSTTCGASIPASTSAACSILVTFKPTTGTTETSTLTVNASPGGPATYALSGTGVALVGKISLSPNGYLYGAAASVQTAPLPNVQYTVQNTGNGQTNPLVIGGFSNGFSLMSANNTCASSYPSGLPAGSECTFYVQFAGPQTGVTFGTTVSSNVTVTDTATDTATVVASGIPLSNTWAWGITPSSYDFGTQTSTIERAFGFWNYGVQAPASPFVVDHVQGSNPNYFTGVSSGCLRKTPAPYNWGCTFYVEFLPGPAGTHGSQSDVIKVLDANDNVLASVPVSGSW